MLERRVYLWRVQDALAAWPGKPAGIKPICRTVAPANPNGAFSGLADPLKKRPPEKPLAEESVGKVLRPKVTVLGKRDIYRAYLVRSKGGFYACYKAALKASPKTQRDLALTLVIESTGRVSSVDIKRNNTGSRTLAECVRKKATRIRFPAKPVTLNRTLRFAQIEESTRPPQRNRG